MGNKTAVIGLGFGDEGKGRVVDYLCTKTKNPLVVRFSGGPQAAHHVVLDNETSHVFSHFGSGTLRGVTTFWSSHCAVNPISMMNENIVLEKLGYKPTIIINDKCPVITPYEIIWNNNSLNSAHGSCGMGIFAVKRREAALQSILFEDLRYPEILSIKINNLEEFYGFSLDLEEKQELYDACQWIRKNKKIIFLGDFMYFTKDLKNHQYDFISNIIFEGSQGLMLDQHHGFFPYVTPSNIGLDNILADGTNVDNVWLVTRAYQTRHGHGPMSPIVANNIKTNPYEKNYDNKIQGEFRRTLLDLDMIRYALNKHRSLRHCKKTLVITCMDLLNNDYRLFDRGQIFKCTDEKHFINKIKEVVKTNKVYTSKSPIGDLKEEE